MAIDRNIAFPVRFNPLKHHRNFILNIVQKNKPEELVNLLNPICNNYIDIYTGDFTPQEIGEEVANQLKKE
ncbi:MAG: hypothetical protein WC384_21980 [Prolixibacteraceae bacterium]|jgi:hypothetical protein